MMIKLNHCVQCFQNLVDMLNVLMKLSICLFLLKPYIKVLGKIRNIMGKGFDSESVYNEKKLKTKIKSYHGQITTNVHDNGISKEG